MPKIYDGRLGLAGLAAFAIWLFAVLPFLYGPPPRFAETSRPPQAHSGNAAQNSNSKPDGSQSAPFFIKIPKTAEESVQDAEDRKEKAATDWWLMIFTGAVAVFTLLLVGATVLLYRAGERQLRLSRQTAERQLRAYVHVADVQIDHDNDEWQPNIRIMIENYGQTPARRVNHRVGTELPLIGPGYFDLKEEPHFSDLGPTQTITKRIMVSHGFWQRRSGPPSPLRPLNITFSGKSPTTRYLAPRSEQPSTGFKLMLMVPDKKATIPPRLTRPMPPGYARRFT